MVNLSKISIKMVIKLMLIAKCIWNTLRKLIKILTFVEIPYETVNDCFHS